MEITILGEFKIVHIREKIDGVNHRRIISPSADISGESQEVQEACNEVWTPEVISAYNAHKESEVI